MLGTIGHYSLVIAFFSSIVACLLYYWYARTGNRYSEQIAVSLMVVKGSLVFLASGLLVYLLLTNQFQYYYVFNYTSADLQTIYLWAAFYSGQEGSFLMWIFFAFLVMLGVQRWTKDPYRGPVMTFLMLSQVFLLSMVVGITTFGIDLGASPFRLLADEMSDAPVFQQNPDFVPADGSGFNDLLRSPWIIIHPPVIFLGFSLMAVPFAYALAALWREKYNEWVYPAMPWTVGANLCLLTAIFLGGYWAYVTLSFGGYWAWDPVENASLVPWIIGLAGIHAMLIQRRHARAQKAALLFAVLAYAAVIYQTFLTRSGVLGDSSVHSFVDLGLYNQLVMFIVVTVALGLGMFLYRYRRLPSPQKEVPLFSREFIMYSGVIIMFLCGVVILIGTSSPILGRLFVDNPTPPSQEFYNNWTLPFAVIIAIMTVINQLMWWRRQDAESLSSALLLPTLLSSGMTISVIILANITEIAYMIYLFAAVFAVVGNGAVLLQVIRRKPKLVGGTVSHIGFGLLLIGFLGSAFDYPMVDRETRQYNQAVAAGEVHDEEGFPVTQQIEFVELYEGESKLINGRYMVTFLDGEITEETRPGEQTYRIKFEDIQRDSDPFIMEPKVYPMLANAGDGPPEWTVEPEVRPGLLSDIYLYIGGSWLVEQEREAQQEAMGPEMQSPTDLGGEFEEPEEEILEETTLGKGADDTLGDFQIRFEEFVSVDDAELPDDAVTGIRARITVEHIETGERAEVTPLFSIVRDGEDQVTFSPAERFDEWDMEAQFTGLDPASEEIDLYFDGLAHESQEQWVLIAAERKPLVAVVWLGTFVLMLGFSISIYRRVSEARRKKALTDKYGIEDEDEQPVNGTPVNGSKKAAGHAAGRQSKPEEGAQTGPDQ